MYKSIGKKIINTDQIASIDIDVNKPGILQLGIVLKVSCVSYYIEVEYPEHVYLNNDDLTETIIVFLETDIYSSLEGQIEAYHDTLGVESV